MRARHGRPIWLLRGPRRTQPLEEDGLEEIIRVAKAKASLAHSYFLSITGRVSTWDALPHRIYSRARYKPDCLFR